MLYYGDVYLTDGCHALFRVDVDPHVGENSPDFFTAPAAVWGTDGWTPSAHAQKRITAWENEFESIPEARVAQAMAEVLQNRGVPRSVIADVIGREGVVLPSEDVVGNASLYRPIEVVEESDDDESEDSDSPTGWDIVYRVGGDGYEGVLFADRASAEYVARIRDALYNSTTWGQFRAKLPTGEWEQKFGDDFDEDWADDKPFEADCAPGHGDGDYPEWLLQSQLDWFPHELIEKYGGTRRGTALNGDALELPADRADEIAEDLRAMGHTVERTDLDIA